MTDDRAGIIRLAEGYMGWDVYPLKRDGYASPEARARHRLVENVEHQWNHFPPGNPSDPWNPFESHADAFDLEAAIPEDKRGRYVFALTLLVCPEGVNGPNPYDISWRLIHAMPRQRSEAALAVLEAK